MLETVALRCSFSPCLPQLRSRVYPTNFASRIMILLTASMSSRASWPYITSQNAALVEIHVPNVERKCGPTFRCHVSLKLPTSLLQQVGNMMHILRLINRF